MKHLLSLFAAVWLAAFTFTACSSTKDDPTPPVAKPGTLRGQITPADAITTVTATDSLNRPITTTPSATGAYVFSSIPAGKYLLSFTPAAGYTAPATQRVSVDAGGSTLAGSTHVTQSGGTATLTVDGTAVPVSLVRAEADFGDLVVTIITASGRSATLRISPYDGTARTGNFAGFSNVRLRYSETAGVAEWVAPSSGAPAGSFSVAPAGTNPLRASGTFSCALQPYTIGATGSRLVAGTFTNVAY